MTPAELRARNAITRCGANCEIALSIADHASTEQLRKDELARAAVQSESAFAWARTLPRQQAGAP
jgi:hypothetical protein